MPAYKYEYNICNEFDSKIFRKQCAALESYIPKLEKKGFQEDVDGSEYQFYSLNGQEVVVKNSFYIGAVYIQSNVDLTAYFN